MTALQSMRFGFTRISHNTKTGPIPVTYSPRATCPDNCQLKGDACYAEAGFYTRLHWDKVDAGKAGLPWDEFLGEIRRLPQGQLWRHNVAGDLPGEAEIIDAEALAKLTRANRGCRGFTYTHYPLSPANVEAVEAANRNGFTVNFSADNVQEAVKAKALTKAPVVCILPIGAPNKQRVDGVPIIACPAETTETDCAHCQWCQKADRQFVIGFRAHGMRKKAADLIARSTS